MRYGNLLQLLAIIALFTLTIFQYNTAKQHTDEVIQRLRLQKSLVNRQSFEEEYGPNYKVVIKEEMERNKQLLTTHWNMMMFKVIGIVVLVLISLLHFIKYFYLDYGDDERLTLRQYDAFTWFINYAFFAVTAGWIAYFGKQIIPAVITYLAGILWAVISLWNISEIVQKQKLRKLVPATTSETVLGAFIFLHPVFLYIGFIIYVVTMLNLKK
jgi:hypothetical protein